MKKAIPIIIGVLVLILAAVVIVNMGGDEQSTKKGDSSMKKTIEEKMDLDLLSWLKKGDSVECILSTSEGEMTVKAQGDSVRINGMPYFFGEVKEEPEPGYAIVTEDYSYFWSGNKGMKFNNKTLEELEEGSDEATIDKSEKEDFDVETWAEEMQEAGTSYECEKKKFSSTDFEPPKDVEFVDWTESLLEMQEMGKQMEEAMNESGEVDMEAMQKAMEGFNMDELMQEMDIPTE